MHQQFQILGLLGLNPKGLVWNLSSVSTGLPEPGFHKHWIIWHNTSEGPVRVL